MPIIGETSLYIFEHTEGSKPRRMQALVAKTLPGHDVIISLQQMKTWGIVSPGFPCFPKEHKTTYLEEEWVRNPMEAYEMHNNHLFHQYWTDMSDQEMKEKLESMFPEVFSEKLSADRKISGDPMKLQYYEDMEEKKKSIKPACTIRDIPAQWLEKARTMINDLLQSDFIEKADEEAEFCSRSMFIPKSCGTKLRLVIDYRQIN